MPSSTGRTGVETGGAHPSGLAPDADLHLELDPHLDPDVHLDLELGPGCEPGRAGAWNLPNNNDLSGFEALSGEVVE